MREQRGKIHRYVLLNCRLPLVINGIKPQQIVYMLREEVKIALIMMHHHLQ